MEKNFLSKIILYFIYLLYFLLCLIIIINAFLESAKDQIFNYTLVSTLILIGLFFSFAVLVTRKKLFLRLSHRPVLIYLIAVCILVKLLFVTFNPIEPSVDYATFYNIADKLSHNFQISQSRYVALFPHVFGYSSFLSIFFYIFGSNKLIPPILNAALSTVSMILIYYIAKNLISEFGAVIACILWILFPSQTIYNIFALSEPLYCTELLGFLAAIICMNKTINTISIWRLTLFGFLLALLLTSINIARPIAAIPIVGYFVWILISDKRGSTAVLKAKKHIMLFVFMLSFYWIFQLVMNWYIGLRLGEVPATVPGYSFYVGFNQNSYGTWNQEDSQLLFSYSSRPGWSATQAQEQMMNEAKRRIFSGNINFYSLFYQKFLVLWSKDDACVQYGALVLKHQITLKIICNSFFYMTIIFSIVGILFAIKKSDRSFIFLVCIFTIGLTCAQMLVEVASRYHYAGILTFTLLGAYGISNMVSAYNSFSNKNCFNNSR